MLTDLFQPIHFPDQNVAVLQTISETGKGISTFRYGANIGKYNPKEIVVVPWEKLFYISRLGIIENNESSILGLSSLEVSNLYGKYGQCDYLVLSPVCAIAYFIPRKYWYKINIISDSYIECGIIYNNKVYYSNGLTFAKVYNLEDRVDYFNGNKARFLHISIEKERLKQQIHQGPDQIEFILRVAGYVNRKGGYFQGQISGDRYIKSIYDLYYFLSKRS